MGALPPHDMGACQCGRPNDEIVEVRPGEDNEDDVPHGDPSLQAHSQVEPASNLGSLLELGCPCGEVTEEEQAAADEENMQAAAEQHNKIRLKAAQERRLIIQASNPVELHCHSKAPSFTPGFTLQAYQAQTVLEALAMRAEQLGLPSGAAVWLQMTVSQELAASAGTHPAHKSKKSWRDIPHSTTLLMAGLSGHAEISILGEDEAKAKVLRANHVAIAEAAREGKVGEVRLVLAIYPEKAHAKDTFKMGYTPLHWAAVKGHCKVAEVLIGVKANPNVKDNYGQCPLHFARFPGHCDVAQILLAAKANVDAKDNNGTTPLHEAASMGQCEVAQLLINHGSNPNATNPYGITPLHQAASRNQCTVAEVLISAQADPNIKNWSKETPMQFAKQNNHHGMIDFLKSHGGVET